MAIHKIAHKKKKKSQEATDDLGIAEEVILALLKPIKEMKLNKIPPPNNCHQPFLAVPRFIRIPFSRRIEVVLIV